LRGIVKEAAAQARHVVGATGTRGELRAI